MTGTAATEAQEFWEIYKLDVVVIPTNKPCIRIDYDDVIYRTKKEKYNAVIDEIERMHKIGRPVLVGTTSVEVSELLSRMLKRRGIPHNVLNAKHHQREAEIVANAGLRGMVTIATNMAGRGTDIKLGPGVAELGGLHVIGTERHEARRIDLQLRGRAGRQGDPGSSRFFLSLEDDLLRLFGSERIANIMQKLGYKEGEPIQHPMVTKSVERAQKKVEQNNFAIRKRLLEYDDVLNKQREAIYSLRRHALLGERLEDDLLDMLTDYVEDIVDKYYSNLDLQGLKDEVMRTLLIDLKVTPDEFEKLGKEGLKEKIYNEAVEFYNRKKEQLGEELMFALMKMSMLQVIDQRWQEHLREMDELREGIHLRAYAQKDPLVEYKTEAFEMFMEMMRRIRSGVLSLVFRMFPVMPEEIQERKPRRPRREQLNLVHQESIGMGLKVAAAESDVATAVKPDVKLKPIRVDHKVGRNDPCPCGSGKKYKHCHGKI
jgi:preprotein translocase subunit SecA